MVKHGQKRSNISMYLALHVASNDLMLTQRLPLEVELDASAAQLGADLKFVGLRLLADIVDLKGASSEVNCL